MKTNTKYIKVSVSDRLPETAGYYFIINRATGKQTGYFNGRTFAESFIDYDYWLQEVPDYEEEMKEFIEEHYQYLNLDQQIKAKTLLTKLKTES